MSLVILYRSRQAIFDGTTNVSNLGSFQRDPLNPARILNMLADGTNIGLVDVRQMAVNLQRPPPAGLGPQIVAKAASLERRQNVEVDDFFLTTTVVRHVDVPAPGPPTVQQRSPSNELLFPYVVLPTDTPNAFFASCAGGPVEPALITSGQLVRVNQEPAAPAQTIELEITLTPVESPKDYIEACRAQASAGPPGPPGPPGPIGPPGPPGTAVQEAIPGEVVMNTDTILATGLSSQPFSVAGVLLFLNGEFQRQGAGNVYQLVGATSQDIEWLADTGTAPNLAVADDIDVQFYS